MAVHKRITNPSEIADIASILSGLTLESPDKVHSQTKSPITLVLLQPLAEPDMLAACRNPASKVMRNGEGEIVGPSNHERLNIQPLGQAWRQALNAVAPFPVLEFDLSLPRSSTESGADGGVEKVYWDTTIPSKGGAGVGMQDVTNLAAAIATVTRLRCKGDVKFTLVWDEDSTRPEAMKRPRKNLAALSAPKVRNSGKTSGEKTAVSDSLASSKDGQEYRGKDAV